MGYSVKFVRWPSCPQGSYDVLNFPYPHTSSTVSVRLCCQVTPSPPLSSPPHLPPHPPNILTTMMYSILHTSTHYILSSNIVLPSIILPFHLLPSPPPPPLLPSLPPNILTIAGVAVRKCHQRQEENLIFFSCTIRQSAKLFVCNARIYNKRMLCETHAFVASAQVYAVQTILLKVLRAYIGWKSFLKTTFGWSADRNNFHFIQPLMAFRYSNIIDYDMLTFPYPHTTSSTVSVRLCCQITRPLLFPPFPSSSSSSPPLLQTYWQLWCTHLSISPYNI